MKSVDRLKQKYMNNIYREYNIIRIKKREYYRSIADYYKLHVTNIYYLIKFIYNIAEMYVNIDDEIKYNIIIKSTLLFNYYSDIINMNKKTAIIAAICTYICLIIELDTRIRFADIRDKIAILRGIIIVRYIIELKKILSSIKYNIYRFYKKYKLDILEIVIL